MFHQGTNQNKTVLVGFIILHGISNNFKITSIFENQVKFKLSNEPDLRTTIKEIGEERNGIKFYLIIYYLTEFLAS